jgi:predicted lipoprotein with Yx(FWY)xxD motif
VKAKLTLIAATCLMVVVSGCGGSDSDSSTAATSPDTTTATTASNTAPASTAKPTGKKIKTVSSQYGKVVADAKGEALYLFTKETGKKSKCYGECADAWPPILTNGEPRAGSGVTESKLGTTKRTDGKTQVTYNGHPLYYYREDSPGKILCQDVAEFGGTWYVVKPSGAAVT